MPGSRIEDQCKICSEGHKALIPGDAGSDSIDSLPGSTYASTCLVRPEGPYRCSIAFISASARRNARVDSSALVLVGSIGMEPVATSTCGRVVEGLTEVVAPEEPLERRLRFHEPGRIVGNFVCRETR